MVRLRVLPQGALRAAFTFACFFAGAAADATLLEAPVEWQTLIRQQLQENSEAAALMEQGLRAVDAGDLARAETIFRQAAGEFPEDPMPLLGLAQTAMRANRETDALRHLEAARVIAPDSAEVLVSQARFHASRGQHEAAEAIYIDALEGDAPAALIDIELGLLYLRQMSRPRDAVDRFSDALTRNDALAAAYYGRGLARADLGETEGAIRDFRAAAARAPDDATPYQALGRLYLAEGDFKAARTAFERGVELNPGFFPMQMDLATAMAADGRIDDALASLEALGRQQPSNPLPLAHAGSLLSRAGMHDRAVPYFEAALARAPDNAALLNDLAWSSAQAGLDLEAAHRHAEAAVRLSDGDPRYVDTLTFIERLQDR
jgi:tetratricopeptide (TPR) repeat protein